MKLRHIRGEFTVCQVKTLPTLDASDFWFVGKTDRELSLVCRTQTAPTDAQKREDGWTMLGVVGELDFSLVGILSQLTTTLKDAGVPVFALSTYDTDYILIKQKDYLQAKTALLQAGYEIEE